MATPTDGQYVPETRTGPRFRLHNGVATIELNIAWEGDARTMREAEEKMRAEVEAHLLIVRGRIAHVIAPPGNMTVKGQLVDSHQQTIVTVKVQKHAPAKAASACGDAGLRGPCDQRGPERHQAGDGPGSGQRDVGPAGDA